MMFVGLIVGHLVLPPPSMSIMKPLTVKIPSSLDSELMQASVREHMSESELVRRAITTNLGRVKKDAAPASALEQAGDLVGCFAGGPADLSSNARHLDGFGKR